MAISSRSGLALPPGSGDRPRTASARRSGHPAVRRPPCTPPCTARRADGGRGGVGPSPLPRSSRACVPCARATDLQTRAATPLSARRRQPVDRVEEADSRGATVGHGTRIVLRSSASSHASTESASLSPKGVTTRDAGLRASSRPRWSAILRAHVRMLASPRKLRSPAITRAIASWARSSDCAVSRVLSKKNWRRSACKVRATSSRNAWRLARLSVAVPIGPAFPDTLMDEDVVLEGYVLARRRPADDPGSCRRDAGPCQAYRQETSYRCRPHRVGRERAFRRSANLDAAIGKAARPGRWAPADRSPASDRHVRHRPTPSWALGPLKGLPEPHGWFCGGDRVRALPPANLSPGGQRPPAPREIALSIGGSTWRRVFLCGGRQPTTAVQSSSPINCQ
jgi:hypothetical protein